MKIIEVNIGLIIEQKLNELDMSKSEFGRKIGIPQQNVNRILDKASIDTERLVKISEALDYNFFQEYLGESETGNHNVSFTGSNNQVNGKGAHGNYNGVQDTGEVALLRDQVAQLKSQLKDKERIIKLIEGREA